MLESAAAIRRIEFQNVGPFKRRIFEFPKSSSVDKAEVHILTGPNGTGKSTLLYALGAVFGWQGLRTERIYERFRGSESGFFYDFENYKATVVGYCGTRPINTLPVELQQKIYYFEHDRANSIYRLVQQTPVHSPPGSALEQYIVSMAQWNPAHIRNAAPMDFAVFGYSGARIVRTAPITAIKEIEDSPFNGAVSFENTGQPLPLMQWVANSITQKVLAQSEGDLQSAKHHGAALDEFTNVVEEITGIKLKFKLARSPLDVEVYVNNEPMQFNVLPDGLKAILGLVANILIRVDRIRWAESGNTLHRKLILFIDEVELHLHPAWQRKILPALQRLLPNAQIFVSTHSPFVIGSLEDAFIYRLDSNMDTITGERGVGGQSYMAVANSVLGIQDYFDIDTEKSLKRFYSIRDRLLERQELTGDMDSEFRNLINNLSSRSEEARIIVAQELKQLKRIASWGLDDQENSNEP